MRKLAFAATLMMVPIAVTAQGMMGQSQYGATPGPDLNAPPIDRSKPKPPEHIARGPQMALALEMAQAIVADCRGQHVGVDVLDAEGQPKLYYVSDGAAGTHAWTAYRKAHTALRYGMSSGEVGQRAATDPALAAAIKADPSLVSWAGGVLLKVGAETIGAVGVSGAEPSAKDESCALTGIRKIQSRLR